MCAQENINKKFISFAKGCGASAAGAIIGYKVAPPEYQLTGAFAGSLLGAIADHCVYGKYDPIVDRKFGYLMVPGGIIGSIIGKEIGRQEGNRACDRMNSDQGFICSNTDIMVKNTPSHCHNSPSIERLRESAVRYKFYHAIHTEKNQKIRFAEINCDEIASHATNVFVVVTIGNRQVVCDDPILAKQLLHQWQQKQPLESMAEQPE